MKLITVVALAVLLVPVQVHARTVPRRGATFKPRRLVIRAPFPCGAKFRVSCGYGPRNGSPAHKRIQARYSTNDYYALDLTRVDLKYNGYNRPVVAVAPGIVRVAGWARRGWAPYGKVVYLEHGYRDRQGKRYHSLYAHLRSVRVRRGQRVRAGQIIGTMGGSSRRRYRRFGPHLHFAMYRGAKRWMGGGQAVVPEPMGRHEDIRRGMVLEACGAPDRRLVQVVPHDELPVFGGLMDPEPVRIKHIGRPPQGPVRLSTGR